MDKSSENNQPVAIKIEGGSNIHLENNVSIGMPLLDAKNVKNLSGKGNKTFLHPHNAPDMPTEKKWSGIAWTLLIAIISGLVVAYLSYSFGWTK